MFERMKDLPEGIRGLRARGTVTREDYEEVIRPILERARRAGEKARMLVQFGPEFDVLTAGAAWADANIGLRYLRTIDRWAVVSDIDWIRTTTIVAGALLLAEVRAFRNDELDRAIEWIGDTAPPRPLTHVMLPSRKVLVLEPHGRLRESDFDAVADRVDTLLEEGVELEGIVVHSARFPGWEDLGGFLDHLRFVRDHHRRIERIALAIDGPIAELLPALARHFVSAELEQFPYDALEMAIEWAEGQRVEAR